MELIEQFKQYMSEGKGLEQQAYKDEIKISCAKNDDEKLNACISVLDKAMKAEQKFYDARSIASELNNKHLYEKTSRALGRCAAQKSSVLAVLNYINKKSTM